MLSFGVAPILECAMLASEIVHSVSIRKKKPLLLNLGLRKSFDGISWDYMYKVMNQIGFDGKLIQWMKNYFSTS